MDQPNEQAMTDRIIAVRNKIGALKGESLQDQDRAENNMAAQVLKDAVARREAEKAEEKRYNQPKVDKLTAKFEKYLLKAKKNLDKANSRKSDEKMRAAKANIEKALRAENKKRFLQGKDPIKLPGPL